MILRVLCGYSEHQRRVQFEGCVAEPLHTITVILPGSKWSCLLLRIVLLDALSEVTLIYPRLKLRVFANDIPAFFSVRNRELVEMAEQGVGRDGSEGSREVEERSRGERVEVVDHRRRERRKEQRDISCRYLEERFEECSKQEGVVMATSVVTLGVDLRTRTEQLGATEKSRRKKCEVRFSLIRNTGIFQESCIRTGVRKLLRTGLVPARVRGGQAVGMARTNRLKLRRQMAAAAGKEESVSLSLLMEVNILDVEEELSTTTPLAWAEGSWMGRRTGEQKEAWRKQKLEVQAWRQVRGFAGAVMCETRDLGIKWPQWHTLVFEGHEAVDKRVVCPEDVEKMLLIPARMVCWRLWAAKHECEELKEGV